MAIADEAMGVLMELNTALGKAGDVFKTGCVTGSLEIRFIRPIPVERVIRATSWLEDTDRRKATLRCEIRDADGNELARCSSIWVAFKSKI